MLDHFTKQKSDFLKKKDKSKKGEIDKDAIKILLKTKEKARGFWQLLRKFEEVLNIS